MLKKDIKLPKPSNILSDWGQVIKEYFLLRASGGNPEKERELLDKANEIRQEMGIH